MNFFFISFYSFKIIGAQDLVPACLHTVCEIAPKTCPHDEPPVIPYNECCLRCPPIDCSFVECEPAP